MLLWRLVYFAIVVCCCLLKHSHSQDASLDEDSKEIRMVFCDISKAFDRVWNQGHLSKLGKFGLTVLQLAGLREMLSEPVAMKGVAFPNITGPKSFDSKIAILGAEPAGIHMAYKLKKLGYTNVVILETEDRIGGSSMTVYHRGVRHELGAGHFRVENTDILSIIRDFRMGPVLPIGDVSVWPDSDHPEDVLPYLLIDASQKLNNSNPLTALNLLSEAVMKYIRIHRNIFGDYNGILMPRPLPNEMQLVNGTIEDFLTRNKLSILKTLFRVLYTSQGYGALENRAALYGLMYVTPKRLLRLIESFIDPSNRGDTYILERGFSALWAEMVNKAKLDVRLNLNISYIIRTPGKVNVFYDISAEAGSMEIYDFLIIARDMSKVLTVVDTSWIERQIFSHLTPSFMTSSLIDTNFGQRAPLPRAYYMYNIISRTNHSVIYHEDSYSILHNIQGTNYSRGLTPGGYDGEMYQSIVVRQYGDSFPSEEDINSGFLNHANLYGITHGLVLARKTWNYFSKFGPEEIAAGLLWDIFTLQGHKNTWYIGSSVCFDSLNNVIDYNNLILQHFYL